MLASAGVRVWTTMLCLGKASRGSVRPSRQRLQSSRSLKQGICPASLLAMAAAQPVCSRAFFDFLRSVDGLTIRSDDYINKAAQVFLSNEVLSCHFALCLAPGT